MSNKTKGQSSFSAGVIALVFLAVGYQTALLLHQSVIAKVAASADTPDTVYVVDPRLAKDILQTVSFEASRDCSAVSYESGGVSPLRDFSYSAGSTNPTVSVRHNARHSKYVEVARASLGRVTDPFVFDPNTVSASELVQLGFTPRQADAIVSYRAKGGSFRRKEDFARSYVVSDSMFKRLSPYISIPKIDLNKADSATLLSLPGIGPYYAGKIISYRHKLGGYSSVNQLLDLRNFGQERLDGLSDLLALSPPEPFKLWSLSEDSLALHPYLNKHSAHSIILYKSAIPSSEWSLEGLEKAGALSKEDARRLSICKIADP